MRSSNTIGEMLLSSLNKVGGTRSYARRGGRLGKEVGDEASRELVKVPANRQKLATLYKCISIAGKMMMVKNSGCIVVGVRGSLMGIRIANKRN